MSDVFDTLQLSTQIGRQSLNLRKEVANELDLSIKLTIRVVYCWMCDSMTLVCVVPERSPNENVQSKYKTLPRTTPESNTADRAVVDK